VHAPVADNECLTCHTPHQADTRDLLTEPVPDLCLQCHDGTESVFTDKHLGATGERMNCTQCHSPHAAKTEALLHDLEHDPFAAGECTVCHVPAGQGGTR